MNRIGIGRTAEAFDVDNDCILKLFYENIPYELIKKEYDINILLSSQIKNMPKVVKLYTMDNRKGIVFQKIKGIHMGKFMSQNPSKISNIIREFSILHQKINQIVLDTNELIISDVNDIKANISKANCINESDKQVIINYLNTTDVKNVCHGDFHPENVLIDSSFNLWVIDWATIIICNKMFDIARTYYILRYGQSPEKKPIYVKLLENIVCRILSKTYFKNRILTITEKKMFRCFYYIILILRLNDGISEETTTLRKLIRANEKSALQEMNRYLKSNFA